MTYREKLLKEHPELNAQSLVTVCCPHEYGYCARPEIECGEHYYEACRACWDREIHEVSAIKDSGDRTQFESGAVRDMREGKGRCDLMPLEVVSAYLDNANIKDPIIAAIAMFQKNKDAGYLLDALNGFCTVNWECCHETMLLEVAKHFEEGAKKYGENNWQKGIPVYCYIDSAIRHYLKWRRGDKDEPHDRAFVWNLMCCIWEVDYSTRIHNAKVEASE